MSVSVFEVAALGLKLGVASALFGSDACRKVGGHLPGPALRGSVWGLGGPTWEVPALVCLGGPCLGPAWEACLKATDVSCSEKEN